jgi:hypothetical protein
MEGIQIIAISTAANTMTDSTLAILATGSTPQILDTIQIINRVSTLRPHPHRRLTPITNRPYQGLDILGLTVIGIGLVHVTSGSEATGRFLQLAADIGFVRTTLADGTLEATGVADRVAIAADLWLAVQRA